MGPLEKVHRGHVRGEVLGSELPVLVEFSTSRCPACHAVRPLLENLAEEFAGRAGLSR